jgi:hypothetical protein
MTMLIELNSDNRTSLRTLFDRYPYVHGSVAAVIEGGMGRVFADASEEPSVALAVLDFHFLAGDPLHANAPLLFKLLRPGNVVIAHTRAWQNLVAATFPDALTVYHREAFQAGQFNVDKLKGFCQALAGLWENWRSAAGEWVRSFAIVTTTPNDLSAELHNRMPVVLGPETWPAWLGQEPADARQLKALLAPYPSEEMTCWPVSARVGNVKNNPSLIEPIAAH